MTARTVPRDPTIRVEGPDGDNLYWIRMSHGELQVAFPLQAPPALSISGRVLSALANDAAPTPQPVEAQEVAQPADQDTCIGCGALCNPGESHECAQPADDLVERLRNIYIPDDGCGPVIDADTAAEAAARIVADAERIRQLNEGLDMVAEERDAFQKSALYWVASASDEKHRAERAEADLAAAREDAERYRAIRAVEAQGQTLAAYDANVDRMYARDDGYCRSCDGDKCTTGPECVTLGRDGTRTVANDLVEQISDDLVERLGFAYNKLSEDILEEAAARIVADAERIAGLVAGLHTEQDRTHRYLARAERAEADLSVAQDYLRRNGHVECDIPACNCGSWHHRYGLPERWDEIKSAIEDAGYPLNNANGHVLLKAVNQMVADLASAREDAERYRWLRDSDGSDPYDKIVIHTMADKWDAAIDAARKVTT